jgi:hypothetical protein
MEKASLSVNLLNAILQYIGQRPYAEVANIIKAIEKEIQEQAEQSKVEND